MSHRALLNVPAPAKLNLHLHIVGRRADGYHLLQSPFVMIDWCDTLHFHRSDDGALVRTDLSTALPDDDLCLRAARALQQASGTHHGATISIDKQVPWGAGMGGGSSDAASTLLALNQLWDLNWSRQRLMDLGLKLGADVPFFIGGQNAFVEGIGEKMTPLALPPTWFAVVKPAAGLETRAIFSSPLLARDKEPDTVASFLDEAGIQKLLDGYGCNVMQLPAEAECPDVTKVAQMLSERFGNSRMTGSGSAVFARAGTGDRPIESLPSVLPEGWVGRMCRSLERHPLAGWATDEQV